MGILGTSACNDDAGVFLNDSFSHPSEDFIAGDEA
jgi:hypothetical protein